MQLMTTALGGKVEASFKSLNMKSWYSNNEMLRPPLFKGLAKEETEFWMKSRRFKSLKFETGF